MSELPLVRQVRVMLDDEKDAQAKYHQMVNAARENGFLGLATTLAGIAQDEHNHYGKLKQWLELYERKEAETLLREGKGRPIHR